MTLHYKFVEYCREYYYEFDADYSEIVGIVKPYIIADGYDWDDEDEITDDLIDDYIDNYMDEIKEYFYDEAYEEWKDAKSYDDDPLGYYGFSIHDFI